MLTRIMLFVDRETEMERLDGLLGRKGGGLAVVWGRRRIGKTRLLVEWVHKCGGVYTVADSSTSEIQRRYFASALAERLAGFGDVEYPDWPTLLTRLASEAKRERWRGPIVVDELPYLVLAAPELPAVLQRWVDHEMRDAGLVVALAGSSQRMMQVLALSASAPLYGRAEELLEIGPLEARYIRDGFGRLSPRQIIETYAAWGGVPRYWELASARGGRGTRGGAPGEVRNRLVHLALDPLGPLHREPDRILLEEIPSAAEVRPVLDAIGAGMHRVSEIAGRVGRPATSLSRPLARLVEMGLVRREVPFGEPARRSKRSLYKIADPFFRFWFRVVAPNRGLLAMASDASRRALLDRHFASLVLQAWEDLCRSFVPRLKTPAAVAKLGPFGVVSRWWRAGHPEWDVVALSSDGAHLLLGEAKWNLRPASKSRVEQALRDLTARRAPDLGKRYTSAIETRVLFVPEVPSGWRAKRGGPYVVTAADLLR